jgi:hypothetical protein
MRFWSNFRIEGYALKPEDVARLSPLTFDHINFLGRYAFALPDSVAHGQLRQVLGLLRVRSWSKAA